MSEARLKAVKNSALWAAYGDALGFITELTDKHGLKKRTGISEISKTVPWKRRIGGRFGPTVDLPSGCYSDDTQLRLSTGRSILGTGRFDVEVFAKIELPVWTSYALGAGRSSKLAATQLARRDANWFSNFFEQKDLQYINGGGNGAAMRIQPHVWACQNIEEPIRYIPDVIRNAVCTHGHPRGLLGAVFHAMCVASACHKGQVPGPDYWQRTIDFFSVIPDIVKQDADLSAFWATTWEGRTGRSIEKSFEEVKWECMEDLEIVASLELAPNEKSYKVLVEKLGGLSPETRGSGTKTAVIASVLSWMYRDSDPHTALSTCANLLFSDTDTIGTMAGAILGCINSSAPKYDIQDREYIEKEATRLFKISVGNNESSFCYPEILDWKPPRTQLDSIGSVDDSVALAGIAIANPIGKKHIGQDKDAFCWQWMELEFGQTVLAKQRNMLPKLPASNTPAIQTYMHIVETATKTEKSAPSEENLDMFAENNAHKGEAALAPTAPRDIDQLTREAISSGFDATVIGAHLVELGQRDNAIELSIAYASIISKAISTRIKSKRQ